MGLLAPCAQRALGSNGCLGARPSGSRSAGRSDGRLDGRSDGQAIGRLDGRAVEQSGGRAGEWVSNLVTDGTPSLGMGVISARAPRTRAPV